MDGVFGALFYLPEWLVVPVVIIGGLPIAGMATGAVVGLRPDGNMTRYAAMAYGVLALAAAVYVAMIGWTDDWLLMGVKGLPVALATVAFVTALELRKPPAMTPAVLRRVCAWACALSGLLLWVAWFTGGE